LPESGELTSLEEFMERAVKLDVRGGFALVEDKDFGEQSAVVCRHLRGLCMAIEIVVVELASDARCQQQGYEHSRRDASR